MRWVADSPGHGGETAYLRALAYGLINFLANAGMAKVVRGWLTRLNFYHFHDTSMLTGLTWEQIEEMGGMSLYDPMASRFMKVA